MLRKLFDLFVFSSLYIALCAVLMVEQTGRLLPGTAASLKLTAFVFFSTICSYNFHWWLTPNSIPASRRVRWTQAHKKLHLLLAMAGATGAAWCFIYLREYWPALCFGALLTFLYSAPKLRQPVFRGLKRIAIGKTIFLSLVWTYVTTMLPVIIARAPWTGACTLFTLQRFFLIYPICILFDFRDREDDKKEGIRSLITYFSERGIDGVFYASLSIFAISTVGLTTYHYRTLIILLLLLPGIILACLYKSSKTKFSDTRYYFVLDGLMMFSGLLMLIFRI